MCRLDGACEVLHLVEIIGGGAQDDRRLLMLGERLRKPEGTIDSSLLDIPLAGPGGNLKLLAIRVHGCVTGCRRLLMSVVAIGRALVFVRGLAEVLVLEQQVCQLVIDARGLGVIRERAQQLSIPAIRLVEVRRFLFDKDPFLVESMVVPGQVGQVCLQEVDNVG